MAGTKLSSWTGLHPASRYQAEVMDTVAQRYKAIMIIAVPAGTKLTSWPLLPPGTQLESKPFLVPNFFFLFLIPEALNDSWSNRSFFVQIWELLRDYSDQTSPQQGTYGSFRIPQERMSYIEMTNKVNHFFSVNLTFKGGYSQWCHFIFKFMKNKKTKKITWSKAWKHYRYF